MGELCRKLGERILGEMLPILRTSSVSPDSRTREGSCLALVEIMCDISDFHPNICPNKVLVLDRENATDTQRESHDDDIVLIVRSALVDDDASVRAAAAQAFDSLQEHLGGKAVDQTIPTLLEALRQPGESSGTALQALKEVMSVRALAMPQALDFLSYLYLLGPRELGLPCAHSNIVVLAYDCIQRSSVRHFGDGRWQCAQQTPHASSELFGFVLRDIQR